MIFLLLSMNLLAIIGSHFFIVGKIKSLSKEQNYSYDAVVKNGRLSSILEERMMEYESYSKKRYQSINEFTKHECRRIHSEISHLVEKMNPPKELTLEEKLLEMKAFIDDELEKKKTPVMIESLHQRHQYIH